MRYDQTLNLWDFTLGGYKTKVTVPHTWNVDDEVMQHRGNAAYETAVFIGEEYKGKKAYLKFNAVYHTAKVYVNDIFAGEHSRSYYKRSKIR